MADSPPPLPKELQFIVDAIYAHWSKARSWPKLDRIRAHVKRELKVALEDLIHAMPHWTIKMPPTNQDDDPIKLTIRGMAYAGRADIAQAFVTLHKEGAKLFINAPNEDPKISSKDFRDLVPTIGVEDFEAISAIILEDFDGSSWGAESPSEWWRRVGEGSVRYESVGDLDEWLRLRDDLGSEVDQLESHHVAILADAYRSFCESGAWPDYLDFLVAHRKTRNIIRSLREFPHSQFWDRRAYGDPAKNRTELRLTFWGALASGAALADLEVVAKAIQVMYRHYLSPDGDKRLPLSQLTEEIKLKPEHLPRFRFLVQEANVGIDIRELPEGWSVKAHSWIDRFEKVAKAGDLLAIWFPQGDWQQEVLKSHAARKRKPDAPKQSAQSGLIGARLKSVPIEIVELVGTGGSADVYRGRVLKSVEGLPPEGSDIAVKITQEWLLVPKKLDETRHRVEREGSLKGNDHRHIVRSFGSHFEVLNGRECPYVLLEFIQGITLKQWIAAFGPATPKQFSDFLLALIEALEFLHQQQIVHRDVKPSNVMITLSKESPRVLLMDLGIAHFEDESDLTTTVHCFGTKRCASPEFLFRKPPEAANQPAVDVYSLGTVAYDLITGKEFLGHLKNEAQIAVEVLKWIPKIETKTFPQSIVNLVKRMLSKRPEDRPPLHQVKEELLRGTMDGEGATSKPSVNTTNRKSRGRKNRSQKTATNEHNEKPGEQPPVLPAPDLLPLKDTQLSWVKFQNFSKDLVASLPGILRCHHYGKQGSKQRGIDIVATQDGGRTDTYQCRQVEKFGASDFRKLVKDTSYKATHHHVLVSCEVDATVRDEVKKRKKWTLWDIYDISDAVRRLPKEVSRKLVLRHFGPYWIKEFLHISETSPFLTQAEFFEALLDGSRLLNHALPLVGRESTISDLLSFAASNRRVAILPGRGGIGKSRVLQAFGEAYAGLGMGNTVVFMSKGLTLTPNHVGEMPKAPAVVVVDDAHQYNELGLLLEMIRRMPPNVRLLLAIRPYSTGSILSALNSASYDPSELLVLKDLDKLPPEDVRTLAKQALGVKYEHLAEQLASVSADSPLVTVVGARLICEKAIPLGLLERDLDFRQAVLMRFRDAILGTLGERIPKKECTALLRLISAIQPANFENKDILECSGKFLGISTTEIRRFVGHLQQAGVVVQRGSFSRITPDVLADHILHDACISESGDTTGYADDILKEFGPVSPSQLMLNLSELDWRVRSSNAKSRSNVLANAWESFEGTFRGASHGGRRHVLGLLKDIAVYQPERMLGLVEYAIRNPKAPPDIPSTGSPSAKSLGHADVLKELPQILRSICFSEKHLRQAVELLWEIGKDVDKAGNPETGFHVLEDLIAYSRLKPDWVQSTILDSIEGWVVQPDAHDHENSPLDLLIPLFEKVAMDQSFRGRTLTMTSFEVSRDGSRPLRSRALRILESCSAIPRIAVQSKVVDVLHKALDEPIALLGHGVRQEFKTECRPEQLDAIARLDRLAKESGNPVIQLKVGDALRWSIQFGPPELRSACKKVISQFENDYEFRLARALTKHPRWNEFFDEDQKGKRTPYKEQEERALQERIGVISEFVKRVPDAKVGLSELLNRLEALGAGGYEGDPWAFMFMFAKADLKYARTLAETIIQGQPDKLTSFLGPLLFGVMEGDLVDGWRLTRQAVESGNPQICKSLCEASSGWLKSHEQGGFDLLRKLLSHRDVEVRHAALNTLKAIGASHSALAIQLALETNTADSPALVAALCDLFDEQHWIPFSALSLENIRAILDRIEGLTALRAHEVGDFLEMAVKRAPRDVVEMFLRRIESYSENSPTDYEAVPGLKMEGQLEGIESAPEYADLVRVVRDRIATAEPLAHYWLTHLFNEIASDYNDACQMVLREWIDSGDPEQILAATRLLDQASDNFVFEHTGFVSHLVSKAIAANPDTSKRVNSILIGITTSGVHSVEPGKPAQYFVDIRDKAKRQAEGLSPGSSPRAFYEELAEAAERYMQRGLDEAREEDD